MGLTPGKETVRAVGMQAELLRPGRAPGQAADSMGRALHLLSRAVPRPE